MNINAAQNCFRAAFFDVKKQKIKRFGLQCCLEYATILAV